LGVDNTRKNIKYMIFFKRLFKPHLKTLSKNIVKLLPLSEVSKDEGTKMKILEYLKNSFYFL